MDTIKKIYNSILQIFHFWSTLLFGAVVKTVITLVSLIGADIVLNFISYLITLSKEENPILADFYPHYYLDSVVIGISIILAIWLLYEAAQKYHKIETELARYSWDDVKIKPYKFPPNSKLGVGLEVVNKKQVTIKQARLPVDSVCMDREDLFGKNNMTLLWVKDNKTLESTRIDICSNERVFATLANWDKEGAYIQSEWGNTDKRPSLAMEINKRYIVDVAIFGRPNDYPLDKGLHFIGELIYDGDKVTLKELPE